MAIDARLGRCDPPFHRRQRAVAQGRDLRKLMAFDVAQHPGGALTSRRARQNRVDPRELDALIGAELVVRQLGERRVGHVAIEAQHAEQSTSPKAPMRLMHGDLSEPAAERRRLTQVAERRERLDERILQRVLCVGVRSEEPRQHRQELPGVAREQLSLRQRRTFLRPQDQVELDARVGGGHASRSIVQWERHRTRGGPRRIANGSRFLMEKNVGDGKNPYVALHIVLVEPEIHWNTGNIGRTALAVGATLHLVEPLGFSLDAAQVKRAGLDYWERVPLRRWPSFAALEAELPVLGTPWLFTTKVARPYWDVAYGADTVLVFGKETAGLPAALLAKYASQTVTIPMVADQSPRSLNLSTAAALAAYEVMRQQYAGRS